MIERFTRVEGETLKIYTMSTWNPYTVVKMRSEFKITREVPRVVTGVRVPVIFITAHDNAATLRGLGEAPGVPCLRKPFDEALLFEAIEAVTGRKSPS
jgi:CheY-like chemotaxis protein